MFRVYILLIALFWGFIGNGKYKAKASSDYDPVVFFDYCDLMEEIPLEALKYYGLDNFGNADVVPIWISGSILSPIQAEKKSAFLWGGNRVNVDGENEGVWISEVFFQKSADDVTRFDELQERHKAYCNYQYGYYETRITLLVVIDKSVYSQYGMLELFKSLSLSIPLERWEGENASSYYFAIADMSHIKMREWNEARFLMQAYDIGKIEGLSMENETWRLLWKYEGAWMPGDILTDNTNEASVIIDAVRSYQVEYSDEIYTRLVIKSSEKEVQVEREDIIKLFKEEQIRIFISPESFGGPGPYYKVDLDVSLL